MNAKQFMFVLSIIIQAYIITAFILNPLDAFILFAIVAFVANVSLLLAYIYLWLGEE